MILFKADDKMYDVIVKDYTLIQVLSRFEIPIGVGDSTIKELCEKYEIDTDTFLAIINFMATKKYDEIPTDKIDLKTLMLYLKRAHYYFLDFSLPMIRTKLIQSINCSVDNKIAFLILKFFDEYAQEMRKHMEYENQTVFVYIDNLLQNKPTSFDLNKFGAAHSKPDNIETKLSELKNVIIKYYPSDSNSTLLNSALFDLYSCEQELNIHSLLEDYMLVPAVHRQYNIAQKSKKSSKVESSKVDEPESISEREKDIIIGVVKGLTNKEIAEKLFISIHTVITHRKNIARKLKIHSASGLTIYAIMNKLIDINDININ